jgi:hypothetical protein
MAHSSLAPIYFSKAEGLFKGCGETLKLVHGIEYDLLVHFKIALES